MANGSSHGKAEEIESLRMGKVTYQTIDVHELKIRVRQYDRLQLAGFHYVNGSAERT